MRPAGSRGTPVRHRGTVDAKEHPAGRLAGLGGSPSMPSITSALSSDGTARMSRRVYGCLGVANTVAVGPSSTMRPAYMTATVLRHLPDDGEVVRHVHRGDPARGAQIGDQLQEMPLGRDIEASCRLVEHDHPWSAGERHGDDDPLLLAAGELVRETAQEGRICREIDGREHLADAPRHVTVVATRGPHGHAGPRRSALPTRRTGLSAAAGSCGTYATCPPRSAGSSRSAMPRISWPSRRTWPPVMCRPRLA